MAPPKDIARSYPKRGLTADVGFRSEPKFCGDGSTEFDGSADKVTAAHYNPSGDYLTATAWVNADTIRFQGLIYNGSTGRNSFLFYMLSTGALRFYWNDTTGDAAIDHQTTLTTGRWYHLAAVMDMSDPADHQVTFYIDGIAATGTRIASGFTGDNNYGFGNEYGTAGWFDGKIADCRIFDVELTQDQIRELYNNPGLDFPSGLTASNLRRHYKLETDFNDSGADSENATASGSPSFTVDRPQLPRGLDLARGASMARVYTGRAVDFDGSADYLETTLDSALGSTFTITAWIYKDNVSSNRFVALAGNGSTGAGSAASIYVNADKLGGWDGATNLNTTLSLSANRWYHVALVANGTTTLTYYLDGQSDTVTSAGVPNPNSSRFLVGAYSPSYFFHDGKISGMKVFNQALTADQIKDLYHYPEQVLPTGVSASNLIHRWALSDYNDTGGTGGRYFQDSAGNNALEDKASASMAFAQPVPCPQLGLQQSATRLYYDGTSGTTYNVEVTGHSLNLPSFSIAFWGFFQSNNPNTTSCCFDTSGGGTFQYFINSTAGNLTVYNGAPTATFNGAVPRDEWVHVVITGHDSSPYIKCYVNGAEKTINSGSAATVGLVATNYYLFSRSANTLSHTGFGDNYSIYDSNLGASEALELYNQGIGYDPRTNVGNYTSASSLIRLYKFDDLTTVKDYSGNNAHADVNGTFKAASFPENASGSTIVGDFSMKRKGVSVLNHTGADDATAIIPAQEAVYPKAGAANGYTIGFCYRKIKDGIAMVWGNTGASTNDQFMCFQQAGPNLRFNLGDGSSRPSVNTSNITDSDWHHYTLTISYATTPAEVKIYVDGAVDHSSTQSITGPPALHPMHLGTGLFDGQGPVGCFKFYQVALSADEVKRLAFSDLRLIKGLANE